MKAESGQGKVKDGLGCHPTRRKRKDRMAPNYQWDIFGSKKLTAWRINQNDWLCGLITDWLTEELGERVGK